VQQRLHPLIRAVEVFGFHLATVDLRQSSDQHELVVAELLAAARIEPAYAQAVRAGAARTAAQAALGRPAA
jgi:phosphoenolpyruvate carboxylase